MAADTYRAALHRADAAGIVQAGWRVLFTFREQQAHPTRGDMESYEKGRAFGRAMAMLEAKIARYGPPPRWDDETWDARKPGG